MLGSGSESLDTRKSCARSNDWRSGRRRVSDPSADSGPSPKSAMRARVGDIARAQYGGAKATAARRTVVPFVTIAIREAYGHVRRRWHSSRATALFFETLATRATVAAFGRPGAAAVDRTECVVAAATRVFRRDYAIPRFFEPIVGRLGGRWC